MSENVIASLVVAASAVPLLPVLHRRAVMREATKVARAAYPAEPGTDWPALYGRLASRELGASLGCFSAVTAMVILFLTTATPEPLAVLGFVVVSVGRSVGALVGHLLAVHRSVAAARVATLRHRDVRHYLLPLEARLSRAAVVIPLAGTTLGAAWWFSGSDASSAAAVVGASAVCLVLVIASAPLAARTLRTGTRVTTEGGLLWAELLRATLLRDAYAGIRGFAATGTALALFVVVFAGQGLPRWFIVGAFATMGAAVGLTAALGLVSSADSLHAWARERVLPEVAR